MAVVSDYLHAIIDDNLNDSTPQTLPSNWSISSASLPANVVYTDNDQTITGVKTHTVAPILQAGFKTTNFYVKEFDTFFLIIRNAADNTDRGIYVNEIRTDSIKSTSTNLEAISIDNTTAEINTNNRAVRNLKLGSAMDASSQNIDNIGIMTINNGVYLKWKDSGGSAQSILQVTTGNETYMRGGTPTGNIVFATGDSGGTPMNRMKINGNGTTVDIDILNADLNMGNNKLKFNNIELQRLAVDARWLVFRHQSDNSHSKILISPKGAPTDTTLSAIAVYGTDVVADSANIQRLLIHAVGDASGNLVSYDIRSDAGGSKPLATMKIRMGSSDIVTYNIDNTVNDNGRTHTNFVASNPTFTGITVAGIIQATDSGAEPFVAKRASQTVGNDIGMACYAFDTNNAYQEYGDFYIRIVDATAGAFSGKFAVFLASGGAAPAEKFGINHNGDVGILATAKLFLDGTSFSDNDTYIVESSANVIDFFAGGSQMFRIASFGIRGKFQSAAADPTTSDIAAGYCTVWKNTASGEVRLWVNDGGSLKSVLLS